MKLTRLSRWKSLKKTEKERLKKVFGKEPEVTSTTISSKELKKYKKDG